MYTQYDNMSTSTAICITQFYIWQRVKQSKNIYDNIYHINNDNKHLYIITSITTQSNGKAKTFNGISLYHLWQMTWSTMLAHRASRFQWICPTLGAIWDGPKLGIRDVPPWILVFGGAHRLVPLDKALVDRIHSNTPSSTRNPTSAETLTVNYIITKQTLPTTYTDGLLPRKEWCSK